MLRRVALAVTVTLLCACARTVSNHDDRVLTTPPAAKMAAVDLAAAYEKDASGSNSQFWGRVVEVTDPIALIVKADPMQPYIIFKTPGPLGIEAHLHDDRAAAVVENLVEGERITLKCLCEGVKTESMKTVVVLKSCVKP